MMHQGDTIRWSVGNSLTGLQSLQQSIRDHLERHAVPAGIAYNVCFAAEEIITNTIKYGYADARPHQISVALSLMPEETVLVIEDDARAFDPRTAAAPDLTLPAEQRPIGGLGLHLVRSLSSRMDYRRQDGRNILEIRFRRDDRA